MGGDRVVIAVIEEFFRKLNLKERSRWLLHEDGILFLK